MDTTTYATLKAEALRSLRNYLATGIRGFLAKGLDRLHALDVRTEACEADGRPGIEHLIRHVEAYC